VVIAAILFEYWSESTTVGCGYTLVLLAVKNLFNCQVVDIYQSINATHTRWKMTAENEINCVDNHYNIYLYDSFR